VVDAVRRHVQASSTASNPIIETDRELIERHLLRATLSMTTITLHLRQDIADAEACGPQDLPAAGSLGAAPTTVTFPWTVPAAAPVKGIVHVPAHNTPMKPGSRETLLNALAKARKWVKGIERGQTFRRDRGPGRKSRTPHPLSRAARFRIAADHHRDYRRHRSGRDHRDDAHNWAFLFLDRAGTTDERPRAPSTPPPAGCRDVLMLRRSQRAARRTETWRMMPDSATRSNPC